MEILNSFLYHPDSPMLFHHGIFLFLFANFLILYALLSQRSSLQKWILILFSAYFYYKSSGIYFFLLFTTIISDYFFSLIIIRSNRFKSLITTIAILFSLSFLLYFKYAKLIITSFGWSAEDFQVDHLFLPIGISFYTFQSISYLVDVKRNKIAIPRFQDYLLYMTFFPHLVAGPIVRAKDFLPQLKRKLRITSAHVSEGFYLITKGLIKKAIIADFVGQYVDIIFASPSGSSGLESLVATLCYTLQIFCDFSGYTDMAIGIALLMGYQLCLNFDSPYQSTSITEFWRRWHISLSTWLRDFIYIPIGGNRKGFALQLLFLLITMSVGGIWHGADWKFLWWGVGHGIILICHKLVIKLLPESNNRWWRLSGWFFTFSAVAILWIPFRALSTSDSIIIIEKIFTSIRWEECWELFRQNTLLISLLIAGFAATLLNQVLKVKLKTWYIREPLMIKMIILLIVIQIMFQMQSATVQPFIYFQF